MSKVYFISDLHLGHKRIHEFAGQYRGNVTSVEEHDAWLIGQWNSVVNKRDSVWVLGDVCFDHNKLPLLDKLMGQKNLILGNHDKFTLAEYGQYFNKIHGFMKREGHWISHAPIHPVELRGGFNIHGHVHHHSLEDKHYVNVCVEMLDGKPILWEDILKVIKLRKQEIENEKVGDSFDTSGVCS